MSASDCVIAPIKNLHRNLLRSVGATLRELSLIGALIEGFDLAGEIPSEEILGALESVVANRDFLVFRADRALSPENFCARVVGGVGERCIVLTLCTLDTCSQSAHFSSFKRCKRGHLRSRTTMT